MMVKVEFKINQPLVEGNIFKFTHKEFKSELLIVKYIQKSRIDGFPIFDIITKFNYPLDEYLFFYKGVEFEIENSYILHTMEDNSYFPKSDIIRRREELLEVSKIIFDISDEDISSEDIFNQKIRDIKISSILNSK
jgi:hypothetical protein